MIPAAVSMQLTAARNLGRAAGSSEPVGEAGAGVRFRLPNAAARPNCSLGVGGR